MLRARLLGLLVALALPCAAQDERPYGVELEVRGRERPVARVSERSFEDYRRILAAVAGGLGMDPSAIREVEYTKLGANGKPLTWRRAELVDPRGRGTWRVEPEYVGTNASPTEYELITPKLTDPAEIARVVAALQASGLVSEGVKSSAHIHVDGTGLIRGQDATGLINVVLLHERMEPLLRRLFAPVRGAGLFNKPATTGEEGAHVNRFARTLYLDHPDLLAELAALRPEERTRAKVEELFAARNAREAALHGGEELGNKGWRYRSLNLLNLLRLNPLLDADKGTVEFRMNDLALEDPATHTLRVKLYRALVERAIALAAAGKLAPAPVHAPVPAGEDPALVLTSADPQAARAQVEAMLKELGLDPREFARLIERNVRARPLLSEGAFSDAVAGLRLPAGFSVKPGLGGQLALDVPVVAAERAAARVAAEALLQRAHAAVALLVASDGDLGSRRSSRVVETEGGLRLLIDVRGLSAAELTELTRLLLHGVGRRIAPAGTPGAPPAPSLVELAVAHAAAVEGRTLPPETRARLAEWAGTAEAGALLPLLAWQAEPYLPEPIRRDLRFRAEAHLAAILAAIEAGQPLTEVSQLARERVATWARETRLGRVLLRSLLPPETLPLVQRTRRAPTDLLRSYRRPDGTVEWKRALKERALGETGGLAHFGLALFLKELAVVAGTGDRARIEEFFDALMTTDFYKEYGLFALGARAGEVMYVRYLERYVKPRFVNGVLKSNMVLATGLALPQLVNGTFTGKGFAISLGSLGLSSAAVKSGVAGIKWVTDLKGARETGALARTGLGASKWARLGGWFYTAAELAVVLYLAEDIEQRVNGYLDLRAARNALREATEELVRVANHPATTPAALSEAAEKHHALWGDYRNFLYRELLQDEALFAKRLENVAREAKLYADKRELVISRLKQFPALQENVVSRYGSLEQYAAHLVKEDEAKVAKDVEVASHSYTKARAEHLRAVYEDGRRSDPLLRGGEDLGSAAERASTNRLQSYEDEQAILRALRGALERSGRREHAAALAPGLETVERTRVLDERLWRGDGTVAAHGLTHAVQPQR